MEIVQFRAWSNEEQMYIYSNEFNKGYQSAIEVSEFFKLVDIDILEQDTMVCAKYGKYIYEGDMAILRNAFIDINTEGEIIAEVKYINGGFYFWNKEGCCEPIGYKPTAWEIIGNIHDGNR